MEQWTVMGRIKSVLKVTTKTYIGYQPEFWERQLAPRPQCCHPEIFSCSASVWLKATVLRTRPVFVLCHWQHWHPRPRHWLLCSTRWYPGNELYGTSRICSHFSFCLSSRCGCDLRSQDPISRPATCHPSLSSGNWNFIPSQHSHNSTFYVS